MNKMISGREYVALFSMFLLGGSLLVGSSNVAGRDAWLSFLLAGAVMFPFFVMLVRMYRIHPGQSLYQITQSTLGRVAAKIILVILILAATTLAGFTTANFVHFTQVSSLPETPKVAIIIIFLLPALYMVRQGIETIGRWALIVYPVMLVFAVIPLIFSFKNADFSNLKPILYNGIGPVIKGALFYIAYPFAEGFFLLSIMKDVEKEGKKLYKNTAISYCISVFIILMSILRNLVVLGYPTVSLLYYPSYMAVELVNIGNFFQRIEFLVSMSFLINDFTKLVIYLLFATRGLAALFGKEHYKKAAYFPAIAALFIAIWGFQNILQVVSIFQYFPFVALPLLLGFPLLLYIVGEVKRRRKKAR